MLKTIHTPSHRLITIDGAVSIAQEAGLTKMDRRWWVQMVEADRIPSKKGAVPYLLEDGIREFVTQAAMQGAKLSTGKATAAKGPADGA